MFFYLTTYIFNRLRNKDFCFKVLFLVSLSFILLLLSPSAYSAQYAVPDGDDSTGSWISNSGGALWSEVNERPHNGYTDYIYTSSATTAALSLSSVSDPGVDTGHVIRATGMYVQSQDPDGASLTIELRDNGSMIASAGPVALVRDVFTESISYTLTAGEAAYITDYSNLSVRIISSNLSNDDVMVTQVIFEVPVQASAPTLSGTTVSDISTTAADMGATITDDGGDPSLTYGTVWAETSSPTTHASSTTGTETMPYTFTESRQSLPAGTLIYYRGYATNSVGTGYSPEDYFYTEPNQVSALQINNITHTTMDIQWTDNNPNEDKAIVLIKQGSIPSAPADGMYYSASASSDFSAAPDNGDGARVVFAGSDTSVSVFNLNQDTNYTVAVYAYSGFGSRINYQQDNPATGTATTSAIPEMAVIGNGNEILSGDTIPNASDNTDFGSSAVGTFTEKTFTIKNTGIGELDLTGSPLVQISGSSDFLVTQQPQTDPLPTGIPTPTTTTFIVRFTPTSDVEQNATVSIDNTDNDEDPYTFSIKGTGFAAPPTLSDPSVVSIETTSAMFEATITNNGGAAITEYGIQWDARLISNTPLPDINWGELQKRTAASGVDYDNFGNSVSIEGRYMFVGAEARNGSGTRLGAVYRFETIAGDHWTEHSPVITAGDAADWDLFGHSVSLNGDTLAVGAHGVDGSDTNQGAAYIFYKDQGGTDSWGEVKKLVASDAGDSDFFGYSVSISGDTVVVGAYREDGTGADRGAAYVFDRNNGGADNWEEVKKLTASDAANGDYFGHSVSISGDTIAVGAYSKGTDQGAVYVFDRNNGGTDNWGEVKILTASDAANYDKFGYSVSIEGNTIAAGASSKVGSGIDRGAAYVFDRDNGGTDNWGEVKKLTASDTEDNDYFGYSVSIEGDTLVAGANNEGGSGSGRGAAYVFKRDEGGADNWGEVKKLVASDAGDGDFFGQSVSISGNYISVGALLEDGSGTDRGAAYIFEDTDTCVLGNSDPSIPETFSGSCTGLPESLLIKYRAYATNSEGTGYTATDEFYTEPAQVSDLQFSNIDTITMDIQWTDSYEEGHPYHPDAGAGAIVLMKKGGIPQVPEDGNIYSGDSRYVYAPDLGDGTKVVYCCGYSGSVSVSHIEEAGQKYYVAVYANNNGNYQQDSPVVGSFYAEPTPASDIVLSNIASTTMDIQWNNSGYEDGIVVLIKEGESPSDPSDGIDYSGSANNDFSLAPDLGDGTKVVYANTGESVSVTGLTAGKEYFVEVFAYAGSGSETNYQQDWIYPQDSPALDDTYTEPVQASDIVLSNLTLTEMDIQWTDNNPYADTAIVLIKQGSSPPGTPTDGNDYSGLANNNFSLATDLGDGTKAVFINSGISTSVTGLTEGQEYFVAVYAYSGSGSGTNYQQDNPATATVQTECSTSWYQDSDGDTYGNPLVSVQQCSQPVDYVLDSGDCDDSNPNINPYTYWYQDNDNDGFGNYMLSLRQCTQPSGPPDYVLNDMDYDDNDITIGAPLKIDNGTVYFYSSLQAAYDAAEDGDIIMVIFVNFVENLLVNRNISVTLQGGYNGSYSTISGDTILNGDMLVSDGTLTIENFVLQ
jgi:hypothetical protein